MSSIKITPPKDNFISGIKTPFANGTKIFCPENTFGLIFQDNKPLYCFDEMAIFNKKNIPEANIPLFGKAKETAAVFFPYKISGRFVADNKTFKINGKTAVIKWSCEYTAEVDNYFEAANFYNHFNKYTSCWDGDFSKRTEGYLAIGSFGDNYSFAMMNTLNSQVVKELQAYLTEKHEKGEEWRYIVGHDANGNAVVPADCQVLALKLQAHLMLVFQDCGYNLTIHKQNIEYIGFKE